MSEAENEILANLNRQNEKLVQLKDKMGEALTKVKEINNRIERTSIVQLVRDYTQEVVGKAKTLIDASISDPQQRKAMKDILHDQIWDGSYNSFVDRMYDIGLSGELEVRQTGSDQGEPTPSKD